MLNISDIQHFSLGDGNGIRTTVFFKGCNLHCPWCHNPETLSSATQILRLNDAAGEKICGVSMNVEEILADVLTDKEFYDESGGGVTLSGGEVMLQSDGAAALAEQLYRRGVHVIVDTAGNVPYCEFEKINPYTSEYYYDLKAADAEDYKRTTGGDFNLITDNMKRLLSGGKKIRARIPLIPGFNASEEYSEKMCAVLRGIGIKNVDLLPFHRLGSAKYKALGIPYAYAGQPPMSLCNAEKIAEIYGKYFKTKIEK